MTKILLDGEELLKVEFHMAGEDGEYLWIEFTKKDGSTQDSYYLKGTV